MSAPQQTILTDLINVNQEGVATLKNAGLPLLDCRPSTKCENGSCPTREHEVPLFWCTKCRTHKYCSSSCQKLCWPSHRPECQMIADFAQQEMSMTPAQRDLKKYMQTLCTSLRQELGIAARSALRLPWKDNLRETHFIAISVSYKAPETPVESHEDVIGIRQLFKFQNVQVLADSDATETVRLRLKAMRILDKKNLLGDTAYFLVHVDPSLLPTGRNFSIGNPGVPATATFEGRASVYLNPSWDRFLENCFNRQEYPKRSDERFCLFRMEDLKLYESEEFIKSQKKLFDERLKRLSSVDIDNPELMEQAWRTWEEKGEEAAFDWYHKEIQRRSQAKEEGAES